MYLEDLVHISEYGAKLFFSTEKYKLLHKQELVSIKYNRITTKILTVNQLYNRNSFLYNFL